MLKIRRSHDRLIFNMAIPIPGKDSLYIEMGLWLISSISHESCTWFVYCCDFTDFTHIFQGFSKSCDSPSASEETLTNMGNKITWANHKWSYNPIKNKSQQIHMHILWNIMYYQKQWLICVLGMLYIRATLVYLDLLEMSSYLDFIHSLGSISLTFFPSQFKFHRNWILLSI